MNTSKALDAMAGEIDQHLRAIRRTLRKSAEGLTGPQRSVMCAVLRSGGLSLQQASREVGLAHSTVSSVVDRLVKQGLVHRQIDKKDRRVSRIVASKPALPLHRHPLIDALRRAKPGERTAILDGLRALRNVLN